MDTNVLDLIEKEKIMANNIQLIIERRDEPLC